MVLCFSTMCWILFVRTCVKCTRHPVAFGILNPAPQHERLCLSPELPALNSRAGAASGSRTARASAHDCLLKRDVRSLTAQKAQVGREASQAARDPPACLRLRMEMQIKRFQLFREAGFLAEVSRHSCAGGRGRVSVAKDSMSCM